MTFGILLLAVVLALLAGSVGGLAFLWYRVLRRSGEGDLPTCAKCGYATRGLDSLRCPECGADLREVGIKTPQHRGKVGPAMFVLLWSMLLLMPSFVVSGVLVGVGPKTQYRTETDTIVPAKSQQYREVILSVSGTRPFDEMNVTITGNNNQSATATIDLSAMQYGGKQLDRAAILDWMLQVGANPADAAVIDEADELLKIISSVPATGVQRNYGSNIFNYTISRSFTLDVPKIWFAILVISSWVVIWTAGLLLYFRIRKRRSSHNPPPPTG